MSQRVWGGLAVVAAAVALAAVGTFSLAPLHPFAPWPLAGVWWLGAAALLCGFLLALHNDLSWRPVVAAAALAVVLLYLIWSYATWQTLGPLRPHVSFARLTISDFVFYIGLRRGVVLFVIAVLGGWLGGTLGRRWLWSRYISP